MIWTLVRDIYNVIDGKGGWDAAVNEFLLSRIGDTMERRLFSGEEKRQPTLRMSAMGTPCSRKLWYSVNSADEAEPLAPHTRIKFLYGDLLEDLLLSLAVAAGHRVEGLQDTLEIAGIKGHRDAVIDGVTVDVKSASTYSYQKFKDGGLREDDPFGYISQLSSYVYAGRNDPLVTDKTGGAFLVIDKQNGHICLDYHDFGAEVENKEKEFEAVKIMAAQPEPPPRGFEPEPEGKSGNMKLCMQCSYCGYKAKCYPEMRTFIYAKGPVYLTSVVREPKAFEVNV